MRAIRRVIRRPQFWFGLSVLVPIFVWYGVFAAWPIARAIFISLHNWSVLNPAMSQFVGFENYAELLERDLFTTALINTVKYVLALILCVTPLSLLVAALLNSVQRGQRIYLAFIFLPVVISTVAAAVMFRWFYDFNAGLFNSLIGLVGVPPQPFPNSFDQALFSVVAVDVWKSLGYYTVILLAGMLQVPQTLREAARMDGANAWHVFRYVDLPGIRNVLALVTVIVAIQGFQAFTPILVMTEGVGSGGPGRSTTVLPLLIYQDGLLRFQLGNATAVAFVLFAIVMVVTVVQLWILRRSWQR